MKGCKEWLVLLMSNREVWAWHRIDRYWETDIEEIDSRESMEGGQMHSNDGLLQVVQWSRKNGYMAVHKLDFGRNMYGSWKTDRVYVPFLAVSIPKIVNTFTNSVTESPDNILIFSLGRLFACMDG